MNATTIIGDAFGRWHTSWTTTYPTDEQSNAAGERRHPLEDIIIRRRAVCLSDVLAKVRMLREIERGGTWPCKDEMLGSIAADLERLPPATAEIVALADRVLTGVAAYSAAAKGVANFCDDPECQRVSEAYWSAWEELVASPPRNTADIVQKLRAGEAIYAGSDTTEFCEMLWEDCRLLLAKSG